MEPAVATLEEKLKTLDDVQRAALNILDDFESEKAFLENSQRAFLNILEDWDESDKLAKMNEQLQAANRELEAFTYSVAHDLRAPLRQIDGFSKILVEEAGTQLDGTAQRYLGLIREGAAKMGRLVDDLLNLARLGRAELRYRITDLNSLVDAVREELNPETAGRQIEWRVGPLPSVDCDPSLLKVVLMNLLSNAVKFTRSREQAIIEVGATTVHPSQPTFYVRDNGVGFNMQYAQKVFGVFERLHGSRDFEGSGVGLAIVQRVIGKHGGRVWAEAEPDKGASFYFTLSP